jgi:molybdate transport system ATP-binding protein
MSIELRFDLRRGDFHLMVDLNLPARGVTVVFGPSGSGKTLLLRSIAGLERSAGGVCRLDGQVWQDGRQHVLPHRRAVGYVFQEASLFPHLDVRQNLAYAMKRVPEAEQKIGFEEVVNLLGLTSLLTRRTHHLSGGERQRVAIARALLSSPRALLMDEPLAAIDQASKAEILPYLDRLHPELDIPVIYVTHAAEEVARLADYLVLLEAGKVRAAGAAPELLTRSDLPLAHGTEAQAIIEARVAEHDSPDNVTFLDFEGGRFVVAETDLPVGHRVRLRILARDVSLTLHRQTDTSILNIFPARIVELSEEGPSQMVVRLVLAEQFLLARITRRSARLLDLKVGKELFVQIKSVALLV